MTNTKQNEASSKEMKMGDVVQEQRQDSLTRQIREGFPEVEASCLPFKAQPSITSSRKTSVTAQLGQVPLQSFHQPWASSITLHPSLGCKFL